MKLLDGLLRVVLTAVHHGLRTVWSVSRPKRHGAHALALTPAGKVVLVKLRYARGWRVPGGGRPPGEDLIEAALRELREEIGLVSHGEATLARDWTQQISSKEDLTSLVAVKDVKYRPHSWSWEVEQVRDFDVGSLPRDLSPLSARWIGALRPVIEKLATEAGSVR